MTFIRAIGDESRFMFVWTDQRVEQLRQLAGRKLSASEIAKELGSGVTRSAVIGKASRIGVKIDSSARGLSRAKTKAPTPTPSPAVLPGAQVNGSGKHASDCRASEGGASRDTVRRSGEVGTAAAVEQSAAALKPAVDDAPALAPIRVTIHELRESSCRWPLGDPGDLDTFRYCGAKRTDERRATAAGHHRIAYNRAGG